MKDKKKKNQTVIFLMIYLIFAVLSGCLKYVAQMEAGKQDRVFLCL